MSWLGYLGADGLAGGAVSLDHKAAEAALRDKVAVPLKLPLMDLAFGVVRIAVANMTRAIRSVSTERGKDPRDFDLVAFGGNGGLFAAAVARELSLKKVIIPPAAGIFSAFGLLYSNLEHHFTQTMLGKFEELDPVQSQMRWAHLEEEALDILGREGFAPELCRLQRFGAFRYFGQTHELSIPWAPGPVDRSVLRAWPRCSRTRTIRPMVIAGTTTLSSSSTCISSPMASQKPRVPDVLEFQRGAGLIAGRPVWFSPEFGMHPTKIVSRAALPASAVRGPLIISEFDTTILVPPDFQVTRDKFFNVVLLKRTLGRDYGDQIAVLAAAV